MYVLEKPAAGRRQLARHGARLDAVYYCPHDQGECHCRKPETGLFEQAWQRFPQASAQNSLLIGDSLSDIQAGHRLEMKTSLGFARDDKGEGDTSMESSCW